MTFSFPISGHHNNIWWQNHLLWLSRLLLSSFHSPSLTSTPPRWHCPRKDFEKSPGHSTIQCIFPSLLKVISSSFPCLIALITVCHALLDMADLCKWILKARSLFYSLLGKRSLPLSTRSCRQSVNILLTTLCVYVIVHYK